MTRFFIPSVLPHTMSPFFLWKICSDLLVGYFIAKSKSRLKVIAVNIGEILFSDCIVNFSPLFFWTPCFYRNNCRRKWRWRRNRRCTYSVPFCFLHLGLFSFTSNGSFAFLLRKITYQRTCIRDDAKDAPQKTNELERWRRYRSNLGRPTLFYSYQISTWFKWGRNAEKGVGRNHIPQMCRV